jgi:C4-dicarboxylate transporter DctQ subunit
MKKGKMITFYTGVRLFNTFCASLSGLILLFVTFSIFVDVILRYFFGRPSIWITEVSTYLFLYIIFLGTAYTLQQDQHIRVTFLLDFLGRRTKRIINLFTSVFAMIFSFVLLWQTSIMTWTAFREGWTSPTMLNAPYAYIYVSMVFGSLLLCITFLCTTIIQFEIPEPEKPQEKTP